jgi:hypothetical protein
MKGLLKLSLWWILVYHGFALNLMEQPKMVKGQFYTNFEWKAKGNEYFTLSLQHGKVENYWRVLLNGSNLGWLEMGGESTKLLVLKSDLADLKQNLKIQRYSSGSKEIQLKTIAFEAGMKAFESDYGFLQVSALDIGSNESVFSRVTVANKKDQTVDIKRFQNTSAVLRKGLIYFDGKSLKVMLKAGEYHLYVSRGMEWGLSKTQVKVSAGQTTSWQAELRQELDVGDYYSADTHIHTFTYSRHGSAAIEERELSFLGEDLDIAIMTDHNHNTTVKPHLHHHKTTTIDGNEVTTGIGHINIFPVDLNKPVVDRHLKNWKLLHQAIIEHGAQYSILNHPRWPKLRGLPHGPFDKFGFNRETASFRGEVTFPFNAMEVVNSDTRNSDKDPQPLVVFEDWLALRKAGHKIHAVGSSDSHTIKTPMGQGRTYVRLKASPNEENVVQAFQKGKLIVSLGLFAEMIVDGKYQAGDVIPFEKGKEHQLQLNLQAPSWVKARSLHLYANDERIQSWDVEQKDGQVLKMSLETTYQPKSKNDFLVLLALGDGIKQVFWHVDYESSISFTNPISFE